MRLAAQQRGETHGGNAEGGDEQAMCDDREALALIDPPAVRSQAHCGAGPRAKRWCAALNWSAAIAALMESSPARQSPAQISASACAWCGPSRPKICRHAR